MSPNERGSFESLDVLFILAVIFGLLGVMLIILL